jgi:hypothetical protein
LCGLYSLGLHVNDLFFFSIMIFRINIIFVNYKIRSYTQILSVSTIFCNWIL